MSLFKKRERRNIRKKAVALEDEHDETTETTGVGEKTGGEANGQTKPAGKK